MNNKIIKFLKNDNSAMGYLESLLADNLNKNDKILMISDLKRAYKKYIEYLNLVECELPLENDYILKHSSICSDIGDITEPSEFYLYRYETCNNMYIKVGYFDIKNNEFNFIGCKNCILSINTDTLREAIDILNDIKYYAGYTNE